VERDDRAAVATFFATPAFGVSETITLSESATHHARVKRLKTGDAVRLTNGFGSLAAGRIERLRRDTTDVVIARTWIAPRPAPIHLCVPIGDRARMLWLAEKVTELGVASWRPVRFHRSASVSPRGEGSTFAAKTRARMVAALEQSAGAWLPEVLSDVAVEELQHDDRLLRIVLDVSGPPLLTVVPLGARRDVAVVFGPEGGMEASELELLTSKGWRSARLASTILRFETAGVAAAAVLRAASVEEA